MLSNKYLFFDSFKTFFRVNKILILIILTLIILSFFTGFFYVVKINCKFDVSNLQNILLKKFFLNEINFISLFIFKSIFFILIFMLLFFLSFFKFGWLISLLITFYSCFLLGIDCFILIKSIGLFKGIIFVCFSILPFELFFIFIKSIFACKSAVFNKQNSLCKTNFFAILGIENIRIFVTTLFIILFSQVILLKILSKIFVFI